MFTSELGKNCDLSDFDSGMIVGGRQDREFLKLMVSWDFNTQQSLEFFVFFLLRMV